MNDLEKITALETQIDSCDKKLKKLDKEKVYAEAEENSLQKQLQELNFSSIEDATAAIQELEKENQEQLELLTTATESLKEQLEDIEERISNV